MKKGIFLLLSMIAMFYACDYAGDIKDYKEDLAEGGPVNTILVSPSAFTLYVDSEFPSMSYVSVPTNTVDSVVVWSSDTPEVLDVDPETGELKWGTVRNCLKTIRKKLKKILETPYIFPLPVTYK